MPGPVPLDPAFLQAASASVGNIAPDAGAGGGSGTIVVDPGALQAASSSFSNIASAISSTSATLSGRAAGSVGIADAGCDGAYGMAASGLGSTLAALAADLRPDGGGAGQERRHVRGHRQRRHAPRLMFNYGLVSAQLGPASVQITVDPALIASDPAAMSAAAASFSAAGGALNVNSISIGQSAPPASAWHGAGASQFAAAQHALQGRASDLSTASFIAKTLTTLAGQIATAKASIAAAQSQAASINAQTAQLNSSYQARTAAPPSPVNPVPMGPLPGESAIASDLAAQATACMAAAQHANDAARQAFHAAGAAFAGLADRSKANGTNWIDQGGSLASVAHGLYTTPAAASMVLRARLDGINGQVSDKSAAAPNEPPSFEDDEPAHRTRPANADGRHPRPAVGRRL